MKKLPSDLRLATMEERPAFNAANNCIAIRVYPREEKNKRNVMLCANKQEPGTGGLCTWHARELLDPGEWRDPIVEASP